MNPAFADDPLSALALAEAMGGLPRPLNWARPEWAAAVRLARALLGVGRPVRAPKWPEVLRRFGPCMASIGVTGGRWGTVITIDLRLRPGLVRFASDRRARVTLRGTPGAPRVAVSADFCRAPNRSWAYDHLLIDLHADVGEEEFLSDLLALAEEVRGAKEAEG